MKRKRKITKTLLSSLLSESSFDPKATGPFSVIIEEHSKDPVYLENRAKEMVGEAQHAAKANDFVVYHEKMQKAIALIALARAARLVEEYNKE